MDRSPAAPARRCAPAELFSADQWIGTNSVPGCCPRLTSTRSDGRAVPRRHPRQRPLLQPQARRRRRDGSRRTARRCGVERRGDSPVRVMVCHWSRTRPVLSTNGHVVETRRRRAAAAAMATKRALPSRVKKRPSANRRSCRRVARAQAAIGTARSASNASLLEAGDARDVEGALAIVLEARQPRVLVEDLGSRAIGERVAVPEPPRHLAQHPPVGPCASRQRQERALARDAAAPSW